MNKKIIFLIIFITANIYLYCEEFAEIKIFNNLTHTEQISKYTNGGFIEFLLNYSNGYGGMWAQEICDRGFDYIPLGSNQHKYWNYWYNTNKHTDFVKYIDGGYNEYGKYSIEISGDGNLESGIYQKIYINDSISHDFYIYIKNKNAVGTAKLVLFDSLMLQRVFEKELDISNSEWTKISFEIPALYNHYSVNFAITYKGLGAVEIDEASLIPANNELGLRKEYADLFRIWKPSIIRYPGGGFADLKNTYWSDAIRPIDKRLAPHFDQTGHLQRMDMGIDEFVKICKYFEIEPFFVINFNHSIEDAINWIEYCNGDSTTTFGRIRTNNGNPASYNVKYWEIGNEQYIYGMANYIDKYLEFYKSIKKYDSTLKLISDGNSWNNTFDTLVSAAYNEHDIYGFHPCGGINQDSFNNDEKTYLSVVSGKYTERKIKEYEEKIKNYYPKLKLASTEWWSSYGTIKNDHWLYDSISRNHAIEAALWNAAEYLLYIRNPHLIELAARTIGLGMIKQGINKNGKKVIWATPSLYAIAIASNHRGNYIIKNEVNCNTFHLYELDNWVDITPYLDVTTSISNDSLFISVINRHPKESINTNILLDIETNGTKGKIYEISSNHFLDNNNVENPNNILPIEKEWIISNNYIFPKHSFTILAIPIKGISNLLENNDQENKNNILIYPNPINNAFTIQFDTGTFIHSIEMFNIIGEKVFEKNIDQYKNNMTINDIMLQNGIYQVKIDCLTNTFSKNIIITN